MADRITEAVIKSFSEKKVQDRYMNDTRSGLWPSEKILYPKYFKKGSSILDIGCGSGRTTFPLHKMGCEIVGVDITPHMIRNAKKLAREFKQEIKFKVGTATDLDFKNESFDNALFSFNGWDQIPGRDNRLKSIKEAYRVIKPGGHYIFSSHLRTVWGKRLFFWSWQWIKVFILKKIGFKIMEEEWGDRFFKRGESGDFKHSQYTAIPSLKEVKKQIREAGFELVYSEKRLSITEEDRKVPAGNCMFFVCRKPRK